VTVRNTAQPPLPGMGAGRRVARIRRGVDQQVRAQRAMGHIEPVDAGLIAVAVTLADAYDAEVLDQAGSRYVEQTIAGRLVTVLLELRGERRDRPGDAGYDDELAALVTAIRDATRPGPPDDR
jgi:hypothetical protein